MGQSTSIHKGIPLMVGVSGHLPKLACLSPTAPYGFLQLTSLSTSLRTIISSHDVLLPGRSKVCLSPGTPGTRGTRGTQAPAGVPAGYLLVCISASIF